MKFLLLLLLSSCVAETLPPPPRCGDFGPHDEYPYPPELVAEAWEEFFHVTLPDVCYDWPTWRTYEVEDWTNQCPPNSAGCHYPYWGTDGFACGRIYAKQAERLDWLVVHELSHWLEWCSLGKSGHEDPAVWGPDGFVEKTQKRL